MSAVKKLLKSPATQKIAAFLLSLYIRLVYLTSRIDKHIDAEAMPYARGDANGIFAFWHGRMMLCPAFCPPKRKMRVLISRHRDGILISRVIGHFKQETVSGSTSKGGKAAASEILRALDAGDNISITPDGPRGPSQVASRGTVALARMTQKPMLPVTFASSRAKTLGSWDNFQVALPFGRVAFCIGKPMLVPETATEHDEEFMRQQFEREMNALVEKAERLAHG